MIIFCNSSTISFIVKIPNPLVKGLKLTYGYEDFELKKLLFNVIGVLSKDPCAVQVSCDRTEDTIEKKKGKNVKRVAGILFSCPCGIDQ